MAVSLKARWTLVKLNMDGEKCMHVQLTELNQNLVTLIQPMIQNLREMEVEDSSIQKDLANYNLCLTGIVDKMNRATKALLVKPRMVAFLKGENVGPKEVDQILELQEKLRSLEQLMLLKASLPRNIALDHPVSMAEGVAGQGSNRNAKEDFFDAQ
nr:MAG: protein B [Henan sediment noda-like virus 1]